MDNINVDMLIKQDLSSSLFQSFFNCTHEGLIITDENLLIRQANTNSLKILNVKEDTLYKTHIGSILKYDMMKIALETGKNFYNEDCTFYINENRVRCVTNIVPLKIMSKNIGVIVSIRDTTHIHKTVNNIIGYKASFTFEDILSKNPKMRNIIELAKKTAKTNCNILIEGNSGTGKEVFAQAMHNYSCRHKGPFVAVNCAAIPRELVESELFGYERGAFTGASKGGYPGKFELADGGTIFLDEIGELPLDIQSKLLRVLDNLKIVRVGGTYEKSINVRVMAATNRVLLDEVKNKNFREDLYYRLSVMNLHLIPLKERIEDVELLAQYFVNKLNAKNPLELRLLDVSYIDKLKSYNFPGNIRELRNLVERSYYLCEDSLITSKLLNKIKNVVTHTHVVSEDAEEHTHSHSNEILPLEKVEEHCIIDALKFCKGNAVKAAELLQIGKATIYRKISKYNIDLNAF